jgi:hypothetical protein
VQHNGRVQARQCMYLLVAHSQPERSTSQLLAGQYLRAALRSSSSAVFGDTLPGEQWTAAV